MSEDRCGWRESLNGVCWTECGFHFQFDGEYLIDIVKRGFIFCPHCGKQIDNKTEYHEFLIQKDDENG